MSVEITDAGLMWDYDGRAYEQNQKSQKPKRERFLAVQTHPHTHTHTAL